MLLLVFHIPAVLFSPGPLSPSPHSLCLPLLTLSLSLSVSLSSLSLSPSPHSFFPLLTLTQPCTHMGSIHYLLFIA